VVGFGLDYLAEGRNKWQALGNMVTDHLVQ